MEDTTSNKGLYIGGTIVGLIILFFALCFRTVGAGEVGVVTRFGEVNREINSGVAIKMPWPIERLHKLDVRIQKEESNAEAATSDLQDAKATLALNYALNRDKATSVFKEIGTEYQVRIVAPALQESFKAITAEYTASDLLTKRPEVKSKVLADLKTRIEPYGIRIENLNIVNFSFSPEFSKAIEAKQAAAQDAQRAKFNLERAKLDSQSQRVQKTSLSPLLLQKQAIERWDGHMPTYLGGGGIFNIPLQVKK